MTHNDILAYRIAKLKTAVIEEQARQERIEDCSRRLDVLRVQEQHRQAVKAGDEERAVFWQSVQYKINTNVTAAEAMAKTHDAMRGDVVSIYDHDYRRWGDRPDYSRWYA